MVMHPRRLALPAVWYPSYRGYPGNCYSNYDMAADGSRCGNRSAMSRPGGYWSRRRAAV